MVLKCEIPNCVDQLLPNTSFHRIPVPALARHKWIQFIRQAAKDETWSPRGNTALCSHHFRPEDLFTTSRGRSIVRGAVPTVLDNNGGTSRNVYGSVIHVKNILQFDASATGFAALLLRHVVRTITVNLGIDDDASDEITFTEPLKKLALDVQTPTSRTRHRALFIRSPVKRKLDLDFDLDQQMDTPRRKRLKVEHSYSVKWTPRTHGRKLKRQLRTTQKNLEVTKRLAKRRKGRILTLSSVVKGMRSSLGNETANSITDSYSGILMSLVSLTNTNKNKKTGIRYSEAIKKFAVTLHFYSPKAYRFLRTYFTLPHEASIAAWMSSTDCGPGFNMEIISKLGKARLSAINNCMDDTVLQLDEMSIKKDTIWNPTKHKFVGSIDYGTGCELVDPPLASNALVVLLAGLSGGWKIPLGYIFTNKVSGSVQQNLVRTALEHMAEQRINVHAVIADGTNSNVSMFNAFGVVEDLNSLKSSFNALPGISGPVFAIYDIVHMMKLFRNMLHQYRMIYWHGKPVKWIYFEFLEQLQEHELIRAANKLSPQHIHFQNQRMKVRLAVQIFSASVADAIDFCRDDLQLQQFKGSEHTTRFIRLLDAAFDILNSRHPKQPGYKGPMNCSNFLDRKHFLLSICQELRHLNTGTRPPRKKGGRPLPPVPLWKSPRKRAVIGFVVSVHSIIGITERVLFRNEHPLKYVLTYRFCQDLIELLFNKIRGRLGSNNNPNVLEFENTMKRIWHQNLLQSTSTGNSIIQMEEQEIPGGLLPLQRPKPKQQQLIDFELESIDYMNQDSVMSHDFSLFYYNCLVYIGGNIVGTISPKIRCEACRSGLYECEEDPLPLDVKRLIARKDTGGLVYTSLSVFKILQVADKSFRKFLSLGRFVAIKNLDFKICKEVLIACKDMPIFPLLCSHFLDMNPVRTEETFEFETHESKLIKSIVSQFLKIRLHDHGKRYRKEACVNTKRQTLSKLILFRNE